ncbi:MAG: glycosyltransferase family 4 protein [Chloroflexi bacterium]|nr:glycosyltransferase family 4 protein [Chloroflexota bacterium]
MSKYPPIEGQVSTVNYWLAHGLARRGHNVTVVTNANEVDSTCRLLDDDESSSIDKPGVLYTTPFGRSQFHIPWSNPFVTKLAALALEAVQEHRAQVVFSHYLEPYAVAGHLAASLAEVPHVITHSGSDLGRLMHDPALRPVYLEVIRRADLFVAKSKSAAALVGDGARLAAPGALHPYAPPDEFFNPQATALDIDSLLERASTIIRDELGWHVNPFDAGRPTFGMYGKLANVKGTIPLVEALGLLKQESFAFNLILMTRWRHGEEELRDAIRQNGLERDTWLLPFLPNRLIPSWIRSCTAVCYLEQGWPLPSHVTVIPREVLACGVCLIVSSEVRDRSWYRHHLIDNDNCIVVDQPHHPTSLAERLRVVLELPKRAAQLGAAGYAAARRMPRYDAFLDGWEQLFQSSIRLRGSDAYS